MLFAWVLSQERNRVIIKPSRILDCWRVGRRSERGKQFRVRATKYLRSSPQQRRIFHCVILNVPLLCNQEEATSIWRECCGFTQSPTTCPGQTRHCDAVRNCDVPPRCAGEVRWEYCQPTQEDQRIRDDKMGLMKL